MMKFVFLVGALTVPLMAHAVEPEKNSRIAQLEAEVVETTELCDPEEQTDMPTFY